MKYNRTTLHLAISYFDTIIAKWKINEKKLKLVACASLIIAAKFNEKEGRHPDFEKISQIANCSFVSKNFIKKCESEIIQALKWEVNTVTLD